MTNRWTQQLNPEQKAAVLHNKGPLLILAGAGSGKTTVLINRTGRLIEEGLVKPQELCVLTFTNKAARELKSRVSSKIGSSAKGIWAGTFHSFGLQLMKSHHKYFGIPKDFGVIDPTDAGSILKEQLLSFHRTDKNAYDADKLLFTLGQFRETGRRERSKDCEYEEAIEWVLPRYEKRLRQLGVVDFDDLLLKPLELLEEGNLGSARVHSFKQVMVDEFQDTNQVQLRLVRALTRETNNLTVVGDDDQSIYGWRGACIENILGFPKLYPHCTVIKLERNYRSTPEIISVANSVIVKNSKRHAKVLKPTKESGGTLPEVLVFETEEEEAEGVATDITIQLSQGMSPKDIAVLFRSNTQGAVLETEMRRAGHPYRLSGGTAFFDRREIRDVLAYLKCAVKPKEVPFRRILNTPSRGLGDKAIALLEESSLQHGFSFFEAALNWQNAGVDSKTGKALDELQAALKRLPSLLQPHYSSSNENGLVVFLKSIHYPAHLEKTSSSSHVAQKRWKHIELFAELLKKHLERNPSPSSLTDFIEKMDLREVPEEPSDNEIQLMTLHACKGLEFPLVYFVGVEEDIIPHKKLGMDLSEERRLFYVGVTRAKERLIFTRSRKRKKHGKTDHSVPSRFLHELPDSSYTEHIGGRPSGEAGRKALLKNLYAKLDALGVK
jgi:DNA helicase-2/ATP-dependent DNA helicase PcrA